LIDSDKIRDVALGTLVGIFFSSLLEETGIQDMIEDGVSKAINGLEPDRETIEGME